MDFVITGKLQQGLKRNDLHLPTSSWRLWIRLKEPFTRLRPADPNTLTIHIVWKGLKPTSVPWSWYILSVATGKEEWAAKEASCNWQQSCQRVYG